ncbi:MAG: hypothetical protein ACRC8Q_07405 [Aeromonas sp.]
MKSIKQSRLTVEAELKADTATLSDLAKVSLKDLYQYQIMLVTLRSENKPYSIFARCRLLFVCREARKAYKEASRTIASNRKQLAILQHARETNPR